MEQESTLQGQKTPQTRAAELMLEFRDNPSEANSQDKHHMALQNEGNQQQRRQSRYVPPPAVSPRTRLRDALRLLAEKETQDKRDEEDIRQKMQQRAELPKCTLATGKRNNRPRDGPDFVGGSGGVYDDEQQSTRVIAPLSLANENNSLSSSSPAGSPRRSSSRRSSPKRKVVSRKQHPRKFSRSSHQRKDRLPESSSRSSREQTMLLQLMEFQRQERRENEERQARKDAFDRTERREEQAE